MKTIFLGSRAVVDLLVGRCHHHAVLTEAGDWLVVAEISDVELRQQVLAEPDVLELPHPNSRADLPPGAVSRLANAGVNATDHTRDVVEKVVARNGMPVLRDFLDR